jgi:hypothetical protein
MNLVRERIRQVEVQALTHVKHHAGHLVDWAHPDERGRRRLRVLQGGA